MKITILTSGTRGDVQPLVALGRGLQQAGYTVRVATHSPFEPLVTQHGLAFTPVDGDLNALLQPSAEHAALVYSDSLARSVRATLRFLRAAPPVFARMLESAWHAVQGSDLLIVTLPTTWGQQIAERLGIPCVWTLLQPLSRTRQFPSVFQPLRFSLGGRYNWLTHLALEQFLWQPWRFSINYWRQHTLGLAPLTFSGPYHEVYTQRTPFLYGFSEHIVPRPDDWPNHHVITGYWFLDCAPTWQPPLDLVRFLADGPPPVAVGFGSMEHNRADIQRATVLAALAQRGERAVLLCKQGTQQHGYVAPKLYVAHDVPHDWLFPHVSAVVHHGGAGTTAAALRAGAPMVTLPVGVDQLFWGQRAAASGVAPPPLPQRAITPERLRATIATVCDDDGIRQRAAKFGADIRAEHGIDYAVSLIRSYL